MQPSTRRATSVLLGVAWLLQPAACFEAEPPPLDHGVAACNDVAPTVVQEASSAAGALVGVNFNTFQEVKETVAVHC